MLQSIRDKAQGWIAWAIVILITIPFALFGIQEYLGAGGDPAVAEVDGVEITQQQLDRRVRDTRENLRLRLGDAYQQALFEGPAFREQVLSSMVSEAVLRQQAQDWNMRTSDAQWRAFIQSIPAFQTEGRFDKRLYDAAVRNSGQGSEGFVAAVKQDLVTQQLQAGIAGSALVTEREIADQVRLIEQTRQIHYLRVPAASFKQSDAVSEEAAKAYYEAHLADYSVPERVKLEYVRINADMLKPLVEVDEAKLRDYYDQNSDRFQVPEERHTRHILIPANDSNDAEQKAKAEALVSQLRAGADFAELAQANSQDPGSAAKGGDLGWVVKGGGMVKPFEDAVFALSANQVSDPVRSTFGYHIIEVTEVRGGGAYDAVRDQVVAAYRDQQAGDLYFTQLERFTDLAYEVSDSLQPLVDELGLEQKETGWVTRSGGLLADLNVPKVLNAAFSEEVLQQNLNSNVIELGTTDALVLRLKEYEPESTRPFEDVRDQVVAAAAAAQASDKAAEAGRAALEKLQAGVGMATLAADHGWPLKEATLRRDSRDVPAEIIAKAFSLAPPVEGNKIYTGVVSAEGDYLLIEVDKVDYGKLADDKPDIAKLRLQQLSTQRGSGDMQGMTRALRVRKGLQTE